MEKFTEWVEVFPPDKPRDCVMVQSTYIPSGVWDLIEARGRIKVDDQDPPHVYVIYTVRIRRKTLFYVSASELFNLLLSSV